VPISWLALVIKLRYSRRIKSPVGCSDTGFPITDSERRIKKGDKPDTFVGIDLESGINVDRKMLDNIKSRHDTLFLSIGTWIPRRAGAQNENSKDVLHGLDFLADRNSRERTGTRSVLWL